MSLLKAMMLQLVECHVNPDFMLCIGGSSELTVSANVNECKMVQPPDKVKVKGFLD